MHQALHERAVCVCVYVCVCVCELSHQLYSQTLLHTCLDINTAYESQQIIMSVKVLLYM